MDSKLIFLDIDGTIYENSIGITKETVLSIEAARKNGHKVFVATGRPKCEVMEEVTNIGFDGYIYSSGAHIEIAGKNIFMSQIPPKDVDHLINYLQENNLGILVQDVNKCYYNKIGNEVLGKVFFNDFTNSELKRFNDPNKNIYTDISNFKSEDNKVLKFVVFAENVAPLESLRETLKSKYDLIIYDKKNAKKANVVNGELMQLNINKASAVQKVLDYYKDSQKNTICFGDSRNDLEMVQFCEIGVCMENGEEALKKVSNEVCPSVKENGVSKTFKKFNLI